MAAEAVAKLDGKRIDQGGLGSYVIAVQEAMFRPSQAPQRSKQPTSDSATVSDHRVSYAPPDAPKILLRNLFDVSREHSPDQQRSLEEEVGMECMKHGRVLDAEYSREDAAILVTFASVEAARMCATAMHGRFFDQRIISVELWPTGERRSAVQANTPARTPQAEPSQKPQQQQQQSRAADYVGAPPPRIADPPPKKAAVDPNEPTARLRNAATAGGGTSDAYKPLMAFVRATEQQAPVNRPNVPTVSAPASSTMAPSAGAGKKRTAADFFDD